METVSKTEFKAKALELFRGIEQTGESKIITDHGKPTLETRKLLQDKPDPLTLLRGTVVKFETPHDPVDENDWDLA